jgi:alanyl-tRNA synthetase
MMGQEEKPRKRLYYEDARLVTFEARVIGQREMPLAEAARETGLTGPEAQVRPAVRLDQTAFYPTSGGQPYDTGTLSGVPVLEVVEDEDGEIWHLLAQPPGSAAQVSGQVDWSRRFDHMQQHTGQHLLSAGFERVLSAPTVSFHLGKESSTIDLAIPDLSREAARRIEEEVNAVVWENREVAVQELAPQQAADAAAHIGLPLRKPPKVAGAVRVILVDGYDASACGGTHVSATGEIGLIKIVGLERYKGGVRVNFLCGGRALSDYQQAQQILQASSLALSVGREALLEAIERSEEKEKAARRDLRRLQALMVTYEAEELWNAAPTAGGVRVIVGYDDQKISADVRTLVGRLREHERTLILMAAAGDAQADGRKGLHVMVARSDDLPEFDAAAMLREVNSFLGGRGGGSPTLAQGGAPPLGAEKVVDAFHRALVRWDVTLRP